MHFIIINHFVQRRLSRMYPIHLTLSLLGVQLLNCGQYQTHASQGLLTVIRCRIFCLPVGYPEIYRVIKYTEL